MPIISKVRIEPIISKVRIVPIISKVRIEPIIVRLHHIAIYPRAIGIYSEKINGSHFSEIYIFFPSACNIPTLVRVNMCPA